MWTEIKNLSLSDEEKKKYQKEWLVFCKNTIIYWLFVDNTLVWISWLRFFKNKVVFKNNLIFKEYRWKWYFSIMFDFLMKETEWFIREANCNKNSLPIYLKKWFVVEKKYKTITKVTYG